MSTWSLGGCTTDDSGVAPAGVPDSSASGDDSGGDAAGDTGTTPTEDAPSGTDTGTPPTPDSGSPGTDSGTGPGDSGSMGEASAEAGPTEAGPSEAGPTEAGTGEAGPQGFCATQQGLDFCADFDEPNPLSTDAGTNAWTSIVGSSSEVAVSSAQAVSTPDSLLVSLPDGSVNGDRSAKVVEWLTPTNGVTQAIYEFDMYIATWPTTAATGGFATDFQFLDTAGGSDQFGFRIGVFSKGDGTYDHSDVEHNHPTLGGPDDIISPIGISAGQWQHVKMAVAFSTDADGGDSVAFQVYVNKSTTPAVDATYPAPFAKAAFARFAAGMVFAFDGTNKDWGIYYDNFTLKLQ